jgi:hypothetical protein
MCLHVDLRSAVQCRLVLLIRLHWYDYGTRRQNEACGQRCIFLRDHVASGQASGCLRRPQGEQRGAQRRDAQSHCGLAERNQDRPGGLHRWQSLSGGSDILCAGCDTNAITCADFDQIDVERETVEQGGRWPFVLRHSLVERNHADTSGQALGQAVALKHDFAAVERRAKMRGCG